MTDLLCAPWSVEQVTALNAFQAAGRFHPFTCALPHDGPSPVLVAREDGWHCSVTGCEYTQNWAHAWMARPMEADPVETFRERLLRRVRKDMQLDPASMQMVEATFHRANAENCERCSLKIDDTVLYPWMCECVTPPGKPEEQKVAWEPPPPGSRKEQIPDHVLAVIKPLPYVSTACETAARIWLAVPEHPEMAEELNGWEKRLHRRCRLNHKFTGLLCECHCHHDDEEGVVLQESPE